MVTRGEKSAASLTETRDPFAVTDCHSIAGIDGEEPEFVEVSRVEHAQHEVVTFGVCFSIARGDFINRIPNFIPDRREMVAQQREPFDAPVVFSVWNRRLQKDVNRIAHTCGS